MSDLNKYTKAQIYEIVDECFHCYASNHRNDADKKCTELIEKIDNAKRASCAVNKIDQALNLPYIIDSKTILGFNVGDSVEIIKLSDKHEFKIGEEVVIIDANINDNRYEAVNCEFCCDIKYEDAKHVKY